MKAVPRRDGRLESHPSVPLKGDILGVQAGVDDWACEPPFHLPAFWLHQVQGEALHFLGKIEVFGSDHSVIMVDLHQFCPVVC